MHGLEPLKPQDVVIALKLISVGDSWTYPSLARSLGMSASTVHEGVDRLSRARLFNRQRRRVSRADLIEFLEHGVRFAFPAAPGEPVRGVRTGISAEPLRGALLAGEDYAFVWASPSGDAQGRKVVPLHPRAPEAALEDPKLHELLAIADVFRIGNARERELASQELRKQLA